MNDVIGHYNLLVNEGNDPLFDSEALCEYMDKWDGPRFIDSMQLGKAKSVLEIGVGTGRLAVKTAPLCKRFVGIDISDKTIEKARQNILSENVKLVCDDFLSFHFDEKFDVIYSTLTFMHIKEKSSAIKKVASLLNDNGRFLLSIDKSREEFIDMVTRKIRIYPDYPENIINNITSTGLTIEEMYETEHAHIFVAKKGEV